jgi:hypothetical protein
MRTTIPSILTCLALLVPGAGCAVDIIGGFGSSGSTTTEGSGGRGASGRTTTEGSGGRSATTSVAQGGGESGTAGGTVGQPLELQAGFNFVGAFWDGASGGGAERVDLLDPTSGVAVPLGHLGDLHAWSGQLALTADAARVFAFGLDGSNHLALYTMELATGQSTKVSVAATEYLLAGVTDEGLAIAVRWTGSAEVVELLDPVTGALTPAGDFGDMGSWIGQYVYDRAARVVHVVGSPANSFALDLYSLALDTHACTHTPVEHEYFLGGVTAEGAVLGAYWNGPGWDSGAERVDAIDPITGAAADLGQLGDLHTWSVNAITYDRMTGRVHAHGTSWAGLGRLYTLDLGTGASTAVTLPQEREYQVARP